MNLIITSLLVILLILTNGSRWAARAANPPVAPVGVDASTRTFPTPGGPTCTVNPPAGDVGDVASLQGCIAAADSNAAGGTVVVPVATYDMSDYLLPATADRTGWVLIKSANLASLPAYGTRVNNTTDPGNMPTFKGSSAASCIMCATAAPTQSHHYWFAGVKWQGTGYLPRYSLSIGADAVLANQPHHIVVDRNYFSGNTLIGQRAAVSANGANVVIADSSFEHIKSTGDFGSDLEFDFASGPTLIQDNYLEAASIPVITEDNSTAGTPPRILDITLSQNHVIRQLSWKPNHSTFWSSDTDCLQAPTGLNSSGPQPTSTIAGAGTVITLTGGSVPAGMLGNNAEYIKVTAGAQLGQIRRVQAVTTTTMTVNTAFPGDPGGATWKWCRAWTVKSMMDFKGAGRVLIRGNILENQWPKDQSGTIFLLNSPGPLAAGGNVQNVDFRIEYNIFRHSSGGAVLFAGAVPSSPQSTQRIWFVHNLWTDIGCTNWDVPLERGCTAGGTWLDLERWDSDVPDVRVAQNTVIDPEGGDVVQLVANVAGSWRFVRFDFLANIMPHNTRGVTDLVNVGTAALNAQAASYVCQDDLIVGGALADYGTPCAHMAFPATDADVGYVDFAGGDYHLAATSPYKEWAGGVDPGADIDTINSLIRP